MSVRRLADASVQPASFAFSEANAGIAQRWIDKYPKGREQSAVIPLMMLAQEQEGWVTKPAIEAIATMLGMPFIRALEVATFYTQYQLNPVGTRAHVQVCGTTPCMLRGSEALMEVCRDKIHHDPFHTNAEGTLSWEEVECLGACVNAPMVMIFKDTYEDLTPERLGEIIDAFAAGEGASVPLGPQNGRTVSAPSAGLTSLASEEAVLRTTREREDRETAERSAAEQPGEAPAETAAETPAQGSPVPPSKAAKPNTYAAETNGKLRSPSPVKADPAAESTESKAPPIDAAAADMADETVEKVSKRRTHPGTKADEAAPIVSPELQRGEPVGPAGKKKKSAAPPKEPRS